MDSPQELRERAERYRRLAKAVTDPQALKALQELATEYEATAAELAGEDPPRSPDTELG